MASLEPVGRAKEAGELSCCILGTVSRPAAGEQVLLCLQLAEVRQGCPSLVVYLKRPQQRTVPRGRRHSDLFATLRSFSTRSPRQRINV